MLSGKDLTNGILTALIMRYKGTANSGVLAPKKIETDRKPVIESDASDVSSPCTFRQLIPSASEYSLILLQVLTRDKNLTTPINKIF